MAQAHLAAIANLAINLEHFAGKKAREKVLKESEDLAAVRDPK